MNHDVQFQFQRPMMFSFSLRIVLLVYFLFVYHQLIKTSLLEVMSVHFLVILHMFLFFRFSTVKQLNSLHIIRQKLIRYIHKKGKLKRVLIVCIVCLFYNVPKELLLLSLSKCALLVTNIKKNFILLLRLRRVRVRCLSQIV